ncbi:MAG: N-acetyltransferase [Planctomycetota bacterium]
MPVEHDPDHTQFVLPIDGGDDAFLLYQPLDAAGHVAFTSVFVPDTHRGQGLAGQLADAAFTHALRNIKSTPDPIFGIAVPDHVPGVPDDILKPRNAWPDPAAYDAQAADLAQLFHGNFAQYADGVTALVRNAGPLQADTASSARRRSGD